MWGTCQEKVRKKQKKGLKNVDYSNNPKKNFPGGLSIAPPPEIAHQGREINLKIWGGEKKKSNLCHSIAPWFKEKGE